MGRGVDYLSGAVAVAYIETSEFVGYGLDDPDLASIFWDEAVQDVLTRLQERWPSFWEVDEWDGRETCVVAKNCHAIVGVAEYNGMTSVSIAVRGDAEFPELAERWIASVETKFVKEFGTIVKLGTMINGVGVYRKSA